jgi:D-glycero-D-manno-heptose 1,7-bisphosphate phosphatase
LGARPGVFVDRDGTLNEERDFIRTPFDLVLIPGAAAAVKRLNDRGIPVCVVSNQSGIARGYMTEEDVKIIHEKLLEELRQEGAWADKIYYCPHHPTEGLAPYRITCECRKPGAGMLRQGARELDLNLERSFVIGDKLIDIRAGKSVDATTVLVLTGYGQLSLEKASEERVWPHKVMPSIVEAVSYVLEILESDEKKS